MKPTSERAQVAIINQISKCCGGIHLDLQAIQNEFKWRKEYLDEGEDKEAQRSLEDAKTKVLSLEANIANLKGLDPSNPLIEVASKNLENFQKKITEIEEAKKAEEANSSSKGFWIVFAIMLGISLIGYIMSELGYE